MKRREFFRLVAGSVASLLLGEAREPEAVEVEGGDPYEITRRALRAFGVKRVASRGDVVLVKPNMGWDRRPEQAADTNPLVVRAVVETAYEAGAKRVMVFDNPCNPAKRTYYRSGIAREARKAGAEIVFLRENHLVKKRIGGEFLKEWEVYRQALEVDRIIDVPIVKHHSLAGATIAMKNLMGLIGGRRGYLHRRIHTAVVDLAAFFKPSLYVVDAYRILKAHGPVGGNLSDVALMKRVLVTGDPVGADAWGAEFLGLRNPPWVKIAGERGLGKAKLKILKA